MYLNQNLIRVGSIFIFVYLLIKLQKKYINYLSEIDIEYENNLNTIFNNYYHSFSIITIATNGYNAHDLVTSLRIQGEWDKNIYIFEDICTPIEKNVNHLKIPNRVYNSIESKKYKTKILQNTSEEFVLFLDSDIIVNKPIKYFLNNIGAWNPECDIYMPKDLWYSGKYIWNSGIIFAKRNKSEKLLHLWYKKLSTNYTKNKDQPALKSVLINNLFNVCEIPDYVVYYLPDISSRLRKIDTPIFTHYLKYKVNKEKC